MAAINMIGQRFGRLTVLDRAGRAKNGNATWLCECDCGKQVVIDGHSLRHGVTRSCGCLSIETVVRRNTTHNETHSRLYIIWKGMKARCYNPNGTGYKNYGGRGITICPEWRDSFTTFRDWALANGYRSDLTIDRIDNDRGYSPDNCRWATMEEQHKNQRRYLKK